MQQWKTVLFDLDGTLVDTIDDLAWTTEQVLIEWGRGTADGTPVHDRKAYQRFVGNGIRKLIDRAFGHSLSDQELDAVLARFLELYDGHLHVYSAPYEGIITVLDAVKAAGIPMGIATNKSEVQARRLVNHLFPDYDFCCVYGNVADRPTKPDPQIVELALRDCKAEKDTTLFVGDSNVDVQTAHNSGLVCCGAGWGFRGEKELQDAGAEIVLRQPIELLTVLGLK